MFSSFGNAGDGISFDDFFGFSEPTAPIVSNTNSTTTSSTTKVTISSTTTTKKETLNSSVTNLSIKSKASEQGKKTISPPVKTQISPTTTTNSPSESSSSSSESEEDSSEESEPENNTKTVASLKKPATLKLLQPKVGIKQVQTNKTTIAEIKPLPISNKKTSPVKKIQEKPVKKIGISDGNNSAKRKYVQTKLDISMFEKKVEQKQPSTDSSLFCMCCNSFISLTSTGMSNSAKKVKNASRHYEWSEHLESETHNLRKERLSRLSILCFQSNPSNKRFHHFINSFCLMFFHQLEQLAADYSKTNKKRKFDIDESEDYLLLDFVINFIYARVTNAEYLSNLERVLKQFLNNMRQYSLKIGIIIWETYHAFYAKMNDEDFGHILSDIVNRGWSTLKHLAHFGNAVDPKFIFSEDPFDFSQFLRKRDLNNEDDETDSTSDEDDENYEESEIGEYDEGEVYDPQHPYFATFSKMYLQEFLFLKPIEKILNESIDEFESILNTQTPFNEWQDQIRERKQVFLSGKQSIEDEEEDEKMIDSSSEEEIEVPQPQAPKQKSIEDLLFGAAASNTFDNFFAVTSPKKPQTNNQPQKNQQQKTLGNIQEMSEDEMWELLMKDNM